jgi:hypothetical protein
MATVGVELTLITEATVASTVVLLVAAEATIGDARTATKASEPAAL